MMQKPSDSPEPRLHPFFARSALIDFYVRLAFSYSYATIYQFVDPRAHARPKVIIFLPPSKNQPCPDIASTQSLPRSTGRLRSHKPPTPR
jgi:hypothetical protein